MIQIIITVILFVLVVYAFYRLFIFLTKKHSANNTKPHELMPIIRKVQVVDVREEPEFRAKHILGARNIPFTQFNQRFTEIRKDQPVYLFSDSQFAVARAARILRKNDYNKENLYIIEGGMDEWPGKVKSNL